MSNISVTLFAERGEAPCFYEEERIRKETQQTKADASGQFWQKMEQIKSVYNKQMNKEQNKVKVGHLTFKPECYLDLYISDSSCVFYVYVSLHFVMLKITRMLLTN